ncbi:maltose ABC transporter permease MalF [Zobellella denitrificans]|uniref:Maltose/maltodextrin transport system permease protein n=1 Tax=Zobellella iuensis TaxID=2803811 RepID=A0ABS1QW67_9GAMM|nr:MULTISPECIES: maltose ABC transporter permease MalF [Zobellella]MBL1379118.1 maltose ABC transporter permease MalF [Zobellella iuensis]OXS14175.1 maltose ABC transporter permease MalF [Zobellella denitrificans]
MQLSETTTLPPKSPAWPPLSAWLKWLCIGGIGLVNAWLVILMYAQGEILFAMLTLVLVGSGLYIFANRRSYSWRYVYPGLAGMGLFVLFPLLCTIGIAFTNYSGKNQLTLERVQQVLQQQRFQTGRDMGFALYQEDEGQWRLWLTDDASGDRYLSDAFSLAAPPQEPLDMSPASEAPAGEAAPLRVITQNRAALAALAVALPDGELLTMSSLRRFAASEPVYVPQDDFVLFNQRTGERLAPNFDIGFYQPIDDGGNFVGEPVSPGFTVVIGWDNFLRVIQDKGIQGPFISIFIWTVLFSGLTVFFTLAVGMVLACLVQWESLRGKGTYRLLLILPYAVPAFISILIFKGLFNQSFGEINMLLSGLFGISPSWFTDPTLARTMLVIVNTWLGYPYMMILCMGLLKAIPEDLYEASAMDGAGPLDNFLRITLPLLLRPLTPLLIASFAFNFNNFVLIQLLTNGRPDMIGTTTPAGYTDLLVSYTYRIAFEGSGTQDFGLAAAIATLIFLLVGALAVLNIKASKLELSEK